MSGFLPVNPRPMLVSLVNKEIRVRLKWGYTEYTGTLISADSYMNLQLANTEEFIDGKSTGTLGQVLFRCNNVLWISEKDASEPGKSNDTEMSVYKVPKSRRLKPRSLAEIKGKIDDGNARASTGGPARIDWPGHGSRSRNSASRPSSPDMTTPTKRHREDDGEEEIKDSAPDAKRPKLSPE
ncbi:hypothetical protein SLS58_002951 [Diplodia intermedia]|uniref:Sm protein F n=1 Tax=Diplodia intermedia TaxID=856260 RepID=A0ABR3TXB0_9PEZI